jgi:hypothetical protein
MQIKDIVFNQHYERKTLHNVGINKQKTKHYERKTLHNVGINKQKTGYIPTTADPRNK